MIPNNEYFSGIWILIIVFRFLEYWFWYYNFEFRFSEFISGIPISACIFMISDLWNYNTMNIGWPTFIISICHRFMSFLKLYGLLIVIPCPLSAAKPLYYIQVMYHPEGFGIRRQQMFSFPLIGVWSFRCNKRMFDLVEFLF